MSIVAVDTGGTFTDVVYLKDGALHVLKVPSTPDDPARAVIEGITRAAGTFGQLVHGSTVATNALLERKGAVVALITNRGFEDVVEIGRQNRPQLYALSATRLPPLVERALRFGVSGRLDHEGIEIEAVDESDVFALNEKLRDAHAIAICLLHSYASATHEKQIAEQLRPLGKHLSISSEILPEYREYERTSTTVVNAYVAPLMDGYLKRLATESNVQRVRVMGSAGGAVPVAVAQREPVHTVLSGPAGGVAGALAAARAAGFENIISFDMGGTSTDVSLCPGEPLYTREFSISGMPVAIPVLDIHTVGAGGGSIAWIDAAGTLRVGPQSARAVPGPICYGRGGTDVTVTDANVWLGRLPADAFLGGASRLDRDAIKPHMERLAERLGCSTEEAAEGVITIANTTMEGALRVISVERGFDPIDFTLVAFGGAAGLHAADLAERLSIPRVLMPPHPGALSAFGMLASPVRKNSARTVLLRSDVDARRFEAVFEELEADAHAAMHAEGLSDDVVILNRFVDARYFGQSYELRVPADNWRTRFDEAHARRYGYADPAAVAEAVTLRVEAVTAVSELPPYVEPSQTLTEQRAGIHAGGVLHDARILPRTSVSGVVEGPAVVTEYSATTWVPRGWDVRRLDSGALLMYPSASQK